VRGAAPRFAPGAGGGAGAGAGELAAAARLAPGARAALAATLEAGGAACAQCGDAPEDALVSACGHLFCRQCITVQARLANLKCKLSYRAGN